MDKTTISKLAKENGTPLLVFDHAQIRKNYAAFAKNLPRVKPYYAVKANSESAIVRTMLELGAGFDVASLQEFNVVQAQLGEVSPQQKVQFVRERVIYAHTVKRQEQLREMAPYSPRMTFDSEAEMLKIREHAPSARLVLRIAVPNAGSIVQLSNKFGIAPSEALPLLEKTFAAGLSVEGVSFHVGSQCNNFENYRTALESAARIFGRAEELGMPLGSLDASGNRIRLLDIGGGFPVRYNGDEEKFNALASKLNSEFDKLFAQRVEIIAEPGRFMVANSGTSVMQVLNKAVRGGKPCYYADDGVYHSFSAILFDHLTPVIKSVKTGAEAASVVFGPTCDGLDTITESALLPELELGDLLFARNMGAYTNASATYFNGFPPAKIVHANLQAQEEQTSVAVKMEGEPQVQAQAIEARVPAHEAKPL